MGPLQVLTRLVSQYDGAERTTLFTGTIGCGIMRFSTIYWMPIDISGDLNLLY